MACLNITSLPRHIDELRIILHRKYLNLLAVNETRLHEIIANNEVSIDGYDIVGQTSWLKRGLILWELTTPMKCGRNGKLSS